ncbi:hypothetical protein AKJ52_02215 [candidate division MSBL1 archaeon SCGC-AAA382C18]|uniref:tRNA (guanine(10)-N(2))-dimethyltransferase n=1 Tax=candidate division MSBL1 archaeon SCGC-AAA382C18 TaxID=1698281 RepID=A0A133VJ35_9EURY|nr:hypothetical protein AKJ52_02215 [candidate division MSBL1 archaeon SCGC-AAA382C18]
MRRLTFFLSGEHSTVPPSEVVGAIEAEGCECRAIDELDQVLVVESDIKPREIFDRLGMTHWIGENFGICDIDDLIEVIGNSDLLDFLPHSRKISVRVKRVRKYFPNIDTQKLTKEVADEILDTYDYEVDLEHPDREISIILTEDKSVISIIQNRVDREAIEERRPPERPALHPSTMQPNLARAMVNLARTPRNGKFLDPFCGIGGILIEAGLIGSEPIGADINKNMLDGARKNLEDAGIRNYELREGDARELEFEKADAIATDPPYGRQASTGGSELIDIYKEVLPVLSETLKMDRYLCITAPSDINLEETAEGCPLDLEEKHQERVHKSLARNIYVFRRSRD